MKNIYLFLLCVFVFVTGAKSQVTIGSQDPPAAGAVLELKSDNLGFLPTRVNLSALNSPAPLPGHVKGMIVFNLRIDAAANLREGLYYNDGTRWIYLVSLAYVAITSSTDPGPYPSHIPGTIIYNTNTNTAAGIYPGLYFNTGSGWVRLDGGSREKWFYMPSIVLDVSPTGATPRIVNLYEEFIKQLSSNLTTKNPGAPAKVLATVPPATGLNYYITAYDNSVFTGVSVTDNGILSYYCNSGASDATFMNIVFVEK